ncbi:hypothetical protein L9F63_025109, partial [Diploptera punctata]
SMDKPTRMKDFCDRDVSATEYDYRVIQGYFIYNLTGTRRFACARFGVSQPALPLHKLR